MFYKESQAERLVPTLFQNPTSEFRGAPFWAWNCKIDPEVMLRQIDEMRQMGMGGFHIHCRVGLDTRYLGDEFMDYVRRCNEKAKQENMLCFLYDEDRWPSGSAGGLVTQNTGFRSRFLVFEPSKYQPPQQDGEYMSAAKAIRTGQRQHLCRYEVCLDEDGYLSDYKLLALNSQPGDNIWDAYLEISGTTPWFNNQSYINTLDPKAIESFIQITHERYAANVGTDFGGSIPAIFTDEPQTCHKERLRAPFDRQPIILPYTDDFDQSFLACYGISLLAHLPELLWELPGQTVSQIRYFYHCHVCERFSQAFCDQIAEWCEDHRLMLTGHMMSEWTLFSQTLTMGEAMRPMRGFGLPGIDMLCDRRELSTAKQAQSVAHQFGRPGVMSEIYGVTGWDFDFRGHKLAGDWQAALGITLRVHHLTWMSMAGEAKRDYPACIGAQSPWWREYPYIENHFARLNTALTRGTPRVHVGVIHPIESYWMYWGVQSQTSAVRQEMEQNFTNIIDWLLYGMIDFDFISESILSTITQQTDGSGFPVGYMQYDVVLVLGCHTLRRNTLDCLAAFASRGGKIIFAGEPPRYVDAILDSAPHDLARRCTSIPFSQTAILAELEPWSEVSVTTRQADRIDGSRIEHVEAGVGATNLLYQMRDDGEVRWLFVCHANKMPNSDIAFTEENTIRIKGEWIPTVYDTLTGEIHPIAALYEKGCTCITWYASFHDSILLQLERGNAAFAETPVYKPEIPEGYLSAPEGYTLSEPNVLLLDLAEYRFDDEKDWQAEEEILRIDNLFRKTCGFPLRMEALAQPWVNPAPHKPYHTLHLRFRINCDIPVTGARFAMEELDSARLWVNGIPVDTTSCSYFVDESIRTVGIPDLEAGENEILVQLPFGEKTNVEWCYLLGEFGVTLAGRNTALTAAPARITYGDYSRQGLPFYAGNITYHVSFPCKRAGVLHLKIPHYRGVLMKVSLDGKELGPLAFAPYHIACGKVEEGVHKLEITVFGNRFNAFGAVHNTDLTETWHGPNIWRTTGNKWTYEYRLKEQGILTAPMYWVE